MVFSICVCGSIFDFSEFVICCTSLLRFPWIGAIGTNIHMDINKWGVRYVFPSKGYLLILELFC